MTQTAEKVLSVAVMRELFPKCYFCAATITQTPLSQLVKVAGKNRLGHADCPAEATDAA